MLADRHLREAERTEGRLDGLERGVRVEREERSRALADLQAQVTRLIDESISASRW